MIGFREYLDYSELLLLDVKSEKHDQLILISSLLIAWIALESFVNTLIADFDAVSWKFDLHERAFLTEKKLKLMDRGGDAGKFVLDGTEYKSLEEKILFLLGKFSNNPINKGSMMWQEFDSFRRLRNDLTHPKSGDDLELTIEQVEKSINTSKTIIKFLAKEVINKGNILG